MNASRTLQRLHPALRNTRSSSLLLTQGTYTRPSVQALLQKESVRSVNVFAEFTKSIKRQIDENKEFQKNVKLLSDETNRLAESDAIQAAKKTASQTSKIVKNVGKAVEATLDTPVVKQTGKVIYKVGEVTVKVGQKVCLLI
jgi:hypothetical protein